MVNINAPETKNITEFKKLLAIINTKALKNIEIDPLGEEDWEETNKITTDTIIDLALNIRMNEYDWLDDVCQKLKPMLVGKKVSFYGKNYKSWMLKYKSKIIVKDVIAKNKKVTLIDTSGQEFETLLPDLISFYDDIDITITILD